MLIRGILGGALLLGSMAVCLIAVIGMFRFDYVLNRMHATAMIDSLGVLLAVAGLMVLYGEIFPILKLLLILVFLWMTSPVAAHLIARVEVLTNRHLNDHLVTSSKDEEPWEE